MSTPSAEDRALTIDIAKLALENLAPDELAILPEVADDFFRHPDQATRNAREESLGFGIELALLTPFVLSVTVEVVKFLLQLVRDKIASAKASATATALPPLTAEQLQAVRGMAFEKASGLGMGAPQATSLADAVVGGLLALKPASR